MTAKLKLKTKNGYANATLHRYMTPERVRYSFSFYKVFRAFDHHKDLREFVLDRYGVDIGTRQEFWGI